MLSCLVLWIQRHLELTSSAETGFRKVQEANDANTPMHLLVRTGLVRTGLDWTGIDRTAEDWYRIMVNGNLQTVTDATGKHSCNSTTVVGVVGNSVV